MTQTPRRLRILVLASFGFGLLTGCGGESSPVEGTGGASSGSGASSGLGGTGALASVDNPSGDCAVDDDGGRTCYHIPGPSDQYVPDCQNPLKREYWRVFYTENDTAYVIPRPDATGLQFGICDAMGEGDDPELAALFAENGLCAENADIQLVNSMSLSDALQIAHALHQRLVFTAAPTGIEPHALAVDLHAACQSSNVDLAAAEDVCAAVASNVTEGNCDGPPPFVDDASASLLVDALNDIYGI